MAKGKEEKGLKNKCVQIWECIWKIDIECVRWSGLAGLGIDLWVGCALPRHHEYDPMSDRRLRGRRGDLSKENTHNRQFLMKRKEGGNQWQMEVEEEEEEEVMEI